jgi:hypothetical protein
MNASLAHPNVVSSKLRDLSQSHSPRFQLTTWPDLYRLRTEAHTAAYTSHITEASCGP